MNKINPPKHILLLSILFFGLVSFSSLIYINMDTLKDEDIIMNDVNNYSGFTESSEAKEVDIPFSGFLKQDQLQEDSVQYYYFGESCFIGFKTSSVIYTDFSSDKPITVSFSDLYPQSSSINPAGRKLMDHVTNYFYGSIQQQNIPAWEEIWYENLYPGIDLHFYMDQEGLQYDFHTNDKTDLSQLLGEVTELIDQVTHTSSALSQLEIRLKQLAPISSMVDVELKFSTFLGGNNYDAAFDITVDDDGNSYIIGNTKSINFPMLNSYNSIHSGGLGEYDVFVTKLDPTGDLVFSTYIGGNNYEFGYGIALDAAKNIYLTGHSYSSNFPITPNAFDTVMVNNGSMSDAFVTKLNANGNEIIFSTFLGGDNWDFARDLIIDADGNSLVVGHTRSDNFPTANAYNDTHGSQSDPNPAYDMFVTKLNATGTGLVFSTFLGGTSNDRANGVDIDSQGNICIVGTSESNNFPVKDAYNSTYYPASGEDVIVTKLNSTGNGLMFSTYIGGQDRDVGEKIMLDTTDNIYIAGYTYSSNFPMKNAYNSSFGGVCDGFITKLNAAGDDLVYSTFIGGNSEDIISDLTLDPSENVIVVGHTESPTFPLFSPFISTYGGNIDIFLLILDSTGNNLVFSTFYGGNDLDRAFAMARDNDGVLYFCGSTASPDFTTINAFNETYGTNRDAFVVKMTIDVPALTTTEPTTSTTTQTTTQTTSKTTTTTTQASKSSLGFEFIMIGGIAISLWVRKKRS